MAETTIREIEDMIAKSVELKKLHDEQKKQTSELHLKLEQLKVEIATKLEALELDCYKGKAGYIYYKYVENFRVPRDGENRTKFFNYLKEQGVFEELITVNSQTLQSYAKEAMAASDELDFQIPGLEKSTPYLKVALTKR